MSGFASDEIIGIMKVRNITRGNSTEETEESVHISNNIRIKGNISNISSDSAVRFTTVPRKPYKSDQKYGK